MHDLMKELFQFLFAGNEEKKIKSHCRLLFLDRTLGAQEDNVTATQTCTMIMTLGFLANVSWQESPISWS